MADGSLESFLRTLGLEDAIDTLREQDIDLALLQNMTAEELKETGLSLGMRLKILEAIKTKDHVRTTVAAIEERTGRDTRTFFRTPVSAKPNIRTKRQVMGNYTNCYGDWIKEEVRIVLVGKTGSGKSATGNTILGRKMFESTVSGSSVTSKCSKQHAVRFNRKILIVDTPGIFDTKQSNDKIQQEIAKCIGITSPGPHAFILVLSITRYTEEEHKSIMHFVSHFGDDIFKYFIVLFTRKDDLDEEGRTLLQHIDTVPPHLKQFIQKSGGRVVAFNNRLKEEEADAQVVELLSIILENVENNEGECYTNQMYRDAEKLIKEREEEELKKAKEERDKEIKEIEKKLAKEYETRFARERERLDQTQSQLEDLKRKHKQDDEQSQFLKQEIKELEKKLKESKGENKEAFKKAIESLQDEMSANNAVRERDARKIKELEKNNERERELREEMEKKRERERKRMVEAANERYRREQECLREKTRNEIEQEKGFFTKIKDKIVSGLKKINPLKLFF